MTDTQMITVADLSAEIEDRAEVDVAELPQTNAYKWFPRENRTETVVLLTNIGIMLGKLLSEPSTPEDCRQTIEGIQNNIASSMVPIIFVRGRELALRSGLTIAEIFKDDDELRIYAYQAWDGPTSVETTKAYRYSIEKGQNNFSSESMILDVWIDEIVEEWHVVAEESSGRELERDAVVEFLESLPADYTMHDAIEDIKEGVHLAGDDEDEEEEEEEKKEEGDDKGDDGGEQAAATQQPAAPPQPEAPAAAPPPGE